MATLNVGAMSARLGLDPAEFLAKMKGVQGFNAFASAEMRREWQQTAREGSESFRLLDESLGIHISRPLTRILTQEFPAFASALQSLLGAGVVGALGVAGFEAFERIARSVEHAQKAEEELQESTRKSEQIFTDTMQSYEKAAKLRSLSGIDKKLFEIDSSSIEEGRKKIDELSGSMQKVAKDAADAHKWTTELLAGIGNAAHIVFNSQSALGIEDIDKKLADFTQRFDALSALDLLKGTHESAKAIADEIEKAKAELTIMTALKLTPMQSFAGEVDKFVPQLGLGPQVGFTPDEIKAQQTFLDNLKKISDLLGASAKDQTGRDDEARKADAAERQLKAQEAIAALQKEMGSSLSKLQPETDPIKKLETEIAGFRMAAENDFRSIRESATSALDVRFAASSLDAYEKRLDALKIKLEGDIMAKQVLDLKGTFPAAPTSAATPISIATPPAVPTLGAGGSAGAQFDTFAKDQAAQLKMAAAAYQDALGPQQRYQLTEQELDLLLGKKLIDQRAYNAALAQAISLKARSAKEGLEGSVDELNPGGGKMQELQQRSQVLSGMQSSGVGLDGAKLNDGDIAAIRLEMQAITAEQDQILLKTGGIDAGIKAWADDLQRVQSEGEFVFEALTQASKGFEDNAAKSLIDVLDAQRGGHQKMIKELRQMWSSYFNSLAEMALKHGLQELLAPIGKQISGPLGSIFGAGAKSAGAAATGAAGAVSMTTAGTMLQSAATALLSAAAALRMSGMGSGSGGDGDIGSIIGGGTAVPFFAEGGDATPGSSFISGEAGAEEVSLDRSGGAHITPLGFGMGKNGDTHNYYDQRGAVVTDDLMRKGDALRMMARTKIAAVGEAIANMNEIKRRSTGA